MIQITPQMRILVAVEAVDFRKGIDALVRVCQERLQTDPFSGCVFVFRSRRATAIKVLVYDGQGFWMCQKRLSSGRFGFWPSSARQAGQALEAHALQVLLMGGDPAQARVAPAWRRLGVARVTTEPEEIGAGPLRSIVALATLRADGNEALLPAPGGHRQRREASSAHSLPSIPGPVGASCPSSCARRGTGCKPTGCCATWCAAG